MAPAGLDLSRHLSLPRPRKTLNAASGQNQNLILLIRYAILGLNSHHAPNSPGGDQILETFPKDQKHLEQILDYLPDGIICHDRERRIICFNRAAEALTGYARQEVLGRDCHEAFGRPFCGKQCSFCGEAPDTWTNLDYPLNIVTKTGEPKQVQMAVVGMTDAEGRLEGVLATVRDITSLVGLKVWTEEATGFAGIVGRDPKMVQIYRQIQQVAEHDYPVLITGETGTGKELVAAAIHSESRRHRGPFVPLNCGALPEGLVESELFGHVKGAFSGAVRDKKGRFELAHRGTLFLDEVAELPKTPAGKIAAGLRKFHLYAGGRRTTRHRGRAGAQRHQPGPQAGSGKTAFSRRPLLSPQRGAREAAGLTGTAGRHPAVAGLFSGAGQEPGAAPLEFFRRGRGPDDALPLAGECAGIAERGALRPGRVPR